MGTLVLQGVGLFQPTSCNTPLRIRSQARGFFATFLRHGKKVVTSAKSPTNYQAAISRTLKRSKTAYFLITIPAISLPSSVLRFSKISLR